MAGATRAAHEARAKARLPGKLGNNAPSSACSAPSSASSRFEHLGDKNAARRLRAAAPPRSLHRRAGGQDRLASRSPPRRLQLFQRLIKSPSPHRRVTRCCGAPQGRGREGMVAGHAVPPVTSSPPGADRDAGAESVGEREEEGPRPQGRTRNRWPGSAQRRRDVIGINSPARRHHALSDHLMVTRDHRLAAIR